MVDVLEKAGGNPGRSGHSLSISAARVLYDTREDIAQLFHASDPLRVIFTGNATHAINTALHGLLKPGDTVIASSMEHNAVMRPLRHLEERGEIHLRVAPCTPDGRPDLNAFAGMLDGKIRLVVIIHASNVIGTILPIAEMSHLAHQAGALVMVDAAQSAGVLPIDMQTMGIDLLAFTGHKGLQGPPGTGGLIIGGSVDTSQIESILQGGTGSRSESEHQPEDLPDKYESGTPNLAGIAGLQAGIRWLMKRGIESIRAHEQELNRTLIEGLSVMHGVRVYGTLDPNKSIAIVSITIAGKRVSEVCFRLDKEFGILCRVGLHCAPSAHRTMGTFPEGTVRLALGVFTTKEDILKTVQALEKIARS